MVERFTEEMIRKKLLSRGEEQDRLFASAREKREERFPAREVEVRSVIEISNVCRQTCLYCGMNRRSKRKRYTITRDDLLAIVSNIYSKGRRVLLLQSGENDSRKYVDFISSCVEAVKHQFPDLAVILCMGNLKHAQYRQLRDSGADRYILKFETSNPALYKKIKPGDSLQQRVDCLNDLLELRYQVGTGNMIGLPDQTLQDIVNDLSFMMNFKLTMMSSTVFIPGEDSGYRGEPAGDVDTVLNFMALMRIMNPGLLIPATSSLEKGRRGGQYEGLAAGANAVTVHDGTPPELKQHFPIYSAKRFTPDEDHIREIVSRAELKFAQNGVVRTAL